MSDEFREVLADALTAQAVRAFLDRGAASVDEELRNHLALAGVLRFAGLAAEADLAARDPDRRPDPDRLALLLKNVSFVPSALAVLGYEASLGRSCGEVLRLDIAGRLDDYPAPTAAMRFPHLWLRL